MTNLQTVLGLAQLERLDEFVQRKRNMGKKYTQGLRTLNGVQLPLAKTDYAENIFWVFGLILDNSIGFDAEEAIKSLEKNVASLLRQQSFLRAMVHLILTMNT